MFRSDIIVVLFSSIVCVWGATYDSSFNLNKALRYVRFTGAAYCTDPVWGDDTVNNWSCNACKQYPNVVATTFHGEGRTDANGYVGYDKDANEIIIAFSGTDPLSIENWIDDLDFFKTGYPYCSGCEVHEGFYRAYNSCLNSLKNLTASYRAAHPSATVTVTGHSLGAAMAGLYAAELAMENVRITSIYVFGMPRVGNDLFAEWFKDALDASGAFRIVHHKDPVCHLPPKNWGFHHVPYEVFYTDDYNQWKLCSFEGEDESCSNQYAVNLNVANHLTYLDFSYTTNWLSCEF